MSHMMVTKNPQNVQRSIFDHFWWPSDLTSNLTSISVNLIMSIYYFLWTSSIVQIFDFLTFDNLTSFWQFDIFLTLWHCFKLRLPQPITGLFLLVMCLTCSTYITKYSTCISNSPASLSSIHLYWSTSPKLESSPCSLSVDYPFFQLCWYWQLLMWLRRETISVIMCTQLSCTHLDGFIKSGTYSLKGPLEFQNSK